MVLASSLHPASLDIGHAVLLALRRSQRQARGARSFCDNLGVRSYNKYTTIHSCITSSTTSSQWWRSISSLSCSYYPNETITNASWSECSLRQHSMLKSGRDEDVIVSSAYHHRQPRSMIVVLPFPVYDNTKFLSTTTFSLATGASSLCHFNNCFVRSSSTVSFLVARSICSISIQTNQQTSRTFCTTSSSLYSSIPSTAYPITNFSMIPSGLRSSRRRGLATSSSAAAAKKQKKKLKLMQARKKKSSMNKKKTAAQGEEEFMGQDSKDDNEDDVENEGEKARQDWVMFQQSMSIEQVTAAPKITTSTITVSSDGDDDDVLDNRIASSPAGRRPPVKNVRATAKYKQLELERAVQERQRLTAGGGGEFPPLRYSEAETERLLKLAYSNIPTRTGRRGTRNLRRQARKVEFVANIWKKYKDHLQAFQKRKMIKRHEKKQDIKGMLSKVSELRLQDRIYQMQVYERWMNNTILRVPQK